MGNIQDYFRAFTTQYWYKNMLAMDQNVLNVLRFCFIYIILCIMTWSILGNSQYFLEISVCAAMALIVYRFQYLMVLDLAHIFCIFCHFQRVCYILREANLNFVCLWIIYPFEALVISNFKTTIRCVYI